VFGMVFLTSLGSIPRRILTLSSTLLMSALAKLSSNASISLCKAVGEMILESLFSFFVMDSMLGGEI